MSFPRAKLTRFNEKLPCTPSPADYNIELKTDQHGFISKNGRLNEIKSPVVSDRGSVASVNSTPCFRTPTLPKKKKTIFKLSVRKIKSNDLSNKSTTDLEALKDKIVECNNKDLYIKDLTEQIEDMREQLSDLEKNKFELEKEKNKFAETANELKEDHRVVLQNVYLEQDKDLQHLKQEYKRCEAELLSVQDDLMLLRKKKKLKIDELMESLDTYKELYSKSLKSVELAISEKEEVQFKMKLYKKKTEDQIMEMNKAHEKYINELNEQHINEITNIEYEMLKTISSMQNTLEKEKVAYGKKIKDLQIEIKNEKYKVDQIKDETNAKIKQIEENCKEANLLAEIQMQDKLNDFELIYKLKMENKEIESDEILKECQAISEYNIIQCELEKKNVRVQLENKIVEYDTLQKKIVNLLIHCEQLQTKCNDLEKSNEIKVTKLDETINNVTQELQEALYQKKLYEISINKSHQTIETLKKRLLHSDCDVEQLKSELETCELSNLEYQGKCNQLSEELEIVSRQNEDFELQYKNTIKLTDERIVGLELQLINKVEEYKYNAQNEIDELKQLLESKEVNLHDIMSQLNEQHILNLKAQVVIKIVEEKINEITEINNQQNEDMQNISDKYLQTKKELDVSTNKILLLETNCTEIQHKLVTKIDENVKLQEKLMTNKCNSYDIDALCKQISQLTEKCESYSQYCDYYKVKAVEYEKEIDELEGINKKYIEQSGKYDELLQKYENMEIQNATLEKKVFNQDILIGPFREQLEAYELENNMLLNQRSEAELEAKEIGLKYAQLLGHQNKKQKIKHMMDLKSKIFELMENKKEMELKLKSQSKIIEKLKKEVASLTQSPRKSRIHVSDKENINTPNRTNNRVESPGGPLRERN